MSGIEAQDWLLIPLGVAIGAFGTLVGAGGGFILVPVLLFLYPDHDPEDITSMSLIFVLINAASGSIAYARQRIIDARTALWFALGTLPGSVGGVLLVRLIPRAYFEVLFAVTLIAIALYLLLWRESTAIREPARGFGVVTRRLRDSTGAGYVYSFRLWQGVLLSGVIGFIGALLGIGGGPIQVPMMSVILHFPIHVAVGTSQMVVAAMGGQATATHVFAGHIGLDRSLLQAGLLAFGAIPGAQLGARISRRTRGETIQRILAISLVLVGLRLGFSGFGV